MSFKRELSSIIRKFFYINSIFIYNITVKLINMNKNLQLERIIFELKRGECVII